MQTHIREFLEYLRSQDVSAELVTPFSWGGPLRPLVFGVRRVIDPVSSAASIWWYRYWHGWFLRRALWHTLRRAGDVVIYAQCPVSAKAALDARSSPDQRVVMAVHHATSQADEWTALEMIAEGGRTYRSIRRLECRVIPSLDGIVFVSRWSRDNLGWIDGIDQVPSTVVSNFTRPVPHVGPVRSLGDLVTVGGLDRRKNQVFLLDVLARANRRGFRYTLDVIGRGPDERSLRRRARDLGLDGQVRFLGFRPDVGARLPGYRAYVHAATAEVLPLVIIEAMAAGLPVITTSVGGIPELVDPGREGRFWSPDDPGEAADVLISFLADEPGRAAAGRAAREHFAESFDVDKAAPKLLRFLTVEVPEAAPAGGAGAGPPGDTGRPATTDGDSPGPTPGSGRPDPPRPTGRRLGRRAMPVRVGVTALDQGVASISNFAVGVAVARVAGVTGLGAFALVYAAWLFVVAVHRALVTDPMAIEGDLRKPDAAGHVRSGLAAELSLGLVAAAAFVALGIFLVLFGQRPFGIDFLVLAPWLPFLLAQDYWRWVGFMTAQPGKTLANDVLYDVVQFSGFALLIGLGVRSSALAISVWGVGAVAGAVFGLVQFSVRPALRGGYGRLRLRLDVSKWLVGSNAASWGVSQSYIPLVGIFLGPVGLGGLKAASSLVTGPALVLIQAGGSVGLPEASKGIATGGWAGLRRVERAVTAAGVLTMGMVFVVVALFGRQLLDLIYGSEFGQYAPAAVIIAAGMFFSSLGLGSILSIKATRQTSLLFHVSVVTLVVSVVSTVILVSEFGIDGAAFAVFATSVVAAGGQLMAHHKYSRKAAEALFAHPPAPSEPTPVDAALDLGDLVDEAGADGPAGRRHLDPAAGPDRSTMVPK